MARGDQISVLCGPTCRIPFVMHHGIDCGDGTVIHYAQTAGSKSGNRPKGRVRRDSVDTFTKGTIGPIRVVKERAAFSPDEVVARAAGQLGRQSYSVLFENCEHFARWCRTDVARSRQVERATATAAKVAARTGTKLAVRASAKLGAKGAARVGAPVLLIADGLQAATEIGGKALGMDDADAENVSRGAGLAATVGLGVAVAGPVGATLATGIWLGCEALGWWAGRGFRT